MSYENAPATQLLATLCACCGRPLVDSVSVETGVGPECRRKHGFGEVADEESRAACNRLVYEVARLQDGPQVVSHVLAIDALGFHKLARRIASRLGAIVVEADGEELVVTAPYSEAFNLEARGVPGARFDRERCARVVPQASRRPLYRALRKAYGVGTLVVGTRLAAIA